MQTNQKLVEAIEKEIADNAIQEITTDEGKHYCDGLRKALEIISVNNINNPSPNELRLRFQQETNIAPVFANRLPYINYIEWLEKELITLNEK